MDLVSIRIITGDIKRLVGFYQEITGISPTWYTEDFAELKTASFTLVIASERTLQLFGANIARPADNHSVIIEFRVDDVDERHEKVAALVESVVQKPTTMPWGNRSLLFRDPDGNLVNFFTPVSAEAIRKYALSASP